MKLSEIKTNPSNPRILNKDKVIVCQTCGGEFTSKKTSATRSPKYCCKECYAKSILKLKVCPACNKKYPSYPKTSFCSIDCSKIGRKSMKGATLSEEWRKALSEGRKNSEKCKGKNLYNWKGGKETALERFREHGHKRRSLIKMPLDKWFIRALRIAQRNRCYYCEAIFTPENNKVIEHLTPISKGGDNQNYNIVLSCKSCNSKKHDKKMEDYSIEKNPVWVMKWEDVYTDALLIKDKLILNAEQSRTY